MPVEQKQIDDLIAQKKSEIKRLKAEKRFYSSPRLMTLHDRESDKSAIANAIYNATKDLIPLLIKYKNYSINLKLIENDAKRTIDIGVRLPMLKEQRANLGSLKTKKKKTDAKDISKTVTNKRDAL